METKRMIAYCGLVCSDCGAYIATQKNDDKMRQKIAEEWTKKYNHPFKAADIDCDGCIKTTPKKIGHLNMCTVRKCGMKKSVINCAHCGEYVCEELGKFFEMAPVMKTNLEEIRKGMNK